MVRRVLVIGPTEPTKQDKFYFQHLSSDERRRFVELMNAHVLRIGAPGRFYVIPFFVTRESTAVKV